jgi:secreted trypsin-like serine protease
MLFFNLFIILLNVVFISTACNDSNKTEQNDIKKEMIDERIFGGRFAKDGEAPYQVLLLLDGEFNCGGALLDNDELEKRVVLTAAHCLPKYDFQFEFILNFFNQILKYTLFESIF